MAPSLPLQSDSPPPPGFLVSRPALHSSTQFLFLKTASQGLCSCPRRFDTTHWKIEFLFLSVLNFLPTFPPRHHGAHASSRPPAPTAPGEARHQPMYPAVASSIDTYTPSGDFPWCRLETAPLPPCPPQASPNRSSETAAGTPAVAYTQHSAFRWPRAQAVVTCRGHSRKCLCFQPETPWSEAWCSRSPEGARSHALG